MSDDQLRQQDLERRERETLQALMTIRAAGLPWEADLLALECGVWQQWKAELRAT